MPKVAKDKVNNSKKKVNKTKKKINENVAKNTKDDKFSFDEEIVIGLKRIDEPKMMPEKKKKKQKGKNTKKAKKNKTTVDNYEDNGVIIKSKYMSNYEDENAYDISRQPKKNTKKKKIKKEPKKLTKKQELSKKKRKKIFRVIKILMLLGIIIGGVIYAMLSPIFNIKNITVTGNSKISSETIISLSGLSIDQNIFNFWSNDIKEAVKQNAYIDTVEVKRKLPDSIEINVKERTATYMITLGNAYVYINNQGYILEITSKKLEVPLLIGYNTAAEEIVEGNRLNETDLEKLNDILKIMEAASSSNSDIGSLITQIDISDGNNYILSMPEEKKTIYLGDTTNLSTKILWIDKFLDEEKKNEGTIYLNVNLNTERPYFREKV